MISTLLLCCTLFAADAGDPQPVVVYTALDRGFSEPILEAFERKTGIDVKAAYDFESTKTIGLVNRIRAEKNRPRCDVFWNNEIVNTIRLKQEGLLQACNPPEAANYPKQFKDPDGFWYGFAARARVLIVNTKLVKAGTEPKSIFDLTDAKWKSKVGIAKPLFGTTASHVACLFASLGIVGGFGRVAGLEQAVLLQPDRVDDLVVPRHVRPFALPVGLSRRGRELSTPGSGPREDDHRPHVRR